MQPVVELPIAGRIAASPRRSFRIRELTILISVLASIAIFGVLNPRFLSPESALNVLEGSSTDGLMVIGMTVIIVCGAFDMSVGSNLSFCGLIAGWGLKTGMPLPVVVLTVLIAGTGVGWLNGALVTRIKINPFITTLGTMSIFRGIVWVATRGSTPAGFSAAFREIAWGSLFGIPYPVLLLAIGMIAGDVLLRHMAYLRQVYFVGSNEEAARLTGIHTAQVKTFAFALTGFLVAMAGIIVTSRSNAVDPNAGQGAELRVIAAVIVGGASLSGGRGTILGSFLGLMLMQIITTGLAFVDVPPEAREVAVGLILIIAAVIDRTGASGVGRRLANLLFTTRSKKVERTIIVVLLCVLIGGTFVHFKGGPVASGNTATASAPAGRRQRYVMIAAATGGPYWIDSKNGLRDKANELGVDTAFTGPPTVDINQQIDEVNRAIAQGVDGIMVCPMSDHVAPAIDKAVDLGIPVVCVDADSPSSKRYAFIGTGNYNAGLQGGQYLAKLLNGKGDVALVFFPGADHLTARVNGYKDALAKFPDIHIVKIANGQGLVVESQKQCRAILQAFPNLAGFGCVEAGGGQGAAVAVKQTGKVGQIKIMAMDRDEATLQFIEEGVIDASIGQRTYMMPYLALQMLYDLKNDKIKFVDGWKEINVNPLPPNIDTGSFIINRENVAQFRHSK